MLEQMNFPTFRLLYRRRYEEASAKTGDDAYASWLSLHCLLDSYMLMSHATDLPQNQLTVLENWRLHVCEKIKETHPKETQPPTKEPLFVGPLSFGCFLMCLTVSIVSIGIYYVTHS